MKISLYILIHIILHSWLEELSYSPVKFVFFLKSRLIFNIFYCFCVCKQTFHKLYGYITRKFLGLTMQNFQEIFLDEYKYIGRFSYRETWLDICLALFLLSSRYSLLVSNQNQSISIPYPNQTYDKQRKNICQWWFVCCMTWSEMLTFHDGVF